MDFPKTKYFYNKEDIIAHIKKGEPTLYLSSQTSTVLPFANLRHELREHTLLGNLSTMPGSLHLTGDSLLEVSGFVSWKEARAFCRSRGRDIMTAPTDELAGVLAGIATSCTGERSFQFGNLRSQIVELQYLNDNGVEKKLSASTNLKLGIDLSSYQAAFAPYRHFKNGPFPRMEMETDLMAGTEGQLGVITSAVLKTIPYEEEAYFFILLPKWEEDFLPHLEIFKSIQQFRNTVLACELLDSNSLSYLPVEKNPGKNQDLLYLEVRRTDIDFLYHHFLAKLQLTTEDNIFEMNSDKCRDLRVSVPRAISEINAKRGVTKKGTDVQVSPLHFKELLEFYRSFAQAGVDYNLFGHFGDAHLHFNFMTTPDKNDFCNAELQRLYKIVKAWQGSPFAEHGIGLLKKNFIAPFYNEQIKKTFRELKKEFDPQGKFFPEGFMSC